MGSIHYSLIFANDRIIAARVGKGTGADDVKLFPAFTTLFGAIRGIQRRGRIRASLKEEAIRLRDTQLDKILEMQRENFEVAYADLEKVVVNDDPFGSGTGMIKLVGNISTILQKLGLSATEGLFRQKPRRERARAR